MLARTLRRTPAAVLQGFAFIIMYGTAFMFVKEGLVLMFQHLKQSYLRKQAHLLLAAAVVHVVGQLAFYLLWPLIYLAAAIGRGRMPWAPHGVILVCIIVLLNLLEGYILYVTVKVMGIKGKKAQAISQKRREYKRDLEYLVSEQVELSPSYLTHEGQRQAAAGATADI